MEDCFRANSANADIFKIFLVELTLILLFLVSPFDKLRMTGIEGLRVTKYPLNVRKNHNVYVKTGYLKWKILI